jgi:hypothetical protein
MSDVVHTNRLIGESSPYLLQHAHNPVDWYPWGDEAFAVARQANKPILLSVGYSACHWCHVMERESFENPQIAALMNEHFINIKVDREERPDVDHIYMNAVQLLVGRGGWPMTVFLRPDGKPFYGGTYFPPVERHGMPAFPRVLEFIARKYRESPDDIGRATDEITTRLCQLEAIAGDSGLPAPTLLPDAADALGRAYDEAYGGIGDAPKFPNTAPLDLWLRASHLSGEPRFAEMTLQTLRRMARGGIYDQLGGGFHRYSVDRIWLVPHFEKMLYDNAQLVPLYLSAYQLTGDAFFARIAGETLDYVVREMRDPGGGFYSTQDADSEGVEGKYFVWDRDEVADILGEDVAAIAAEYWDITDRGNFEGRNILHVLVDVEQAARTCGREPADLAALIATAREKLLATRDRRIAPARDEKVLTSWNGLMISAFAKAAEVLGDAAYGQVAGDAVAFVEAALRRSDRLLATYKHGVAKLNGYLDDYAFYANALVDVFEALGDRAYLRSATSLCDSMLLHFWDGSAGGFFFTSDDHEELIVRSKPAFDGSIPSGNSVATHVLLRLYYHTGNTDYLMRAEAVLALFGRAAGNQPMGFANLIAAADFHRRGPLEIAVVVAAGAADHDPLVRGLRSAYIPNRTLTILDPDPAADRPPILSGKGQIGGKTTVYVCRNQTCSAPAVTWAEIEKLLAA